MTASVLLIDCPDESGLVHRVTGVLARAGLNIVSNHEFVDPTAKHFLHAHGVRRPGRVRTARR